MIHQLDPPRRAPTRRGFTLIELLVVISIIAVLAALLFSVAGRVNLTRQQTQCASNLRQIGAALALYAVDHENEWPETAHADDGRTWFDRLRPFLGNSDSVGICPADPLADQRRAEGLTSYIFNEYLAVPLRDPFGREKENFRNRLLLDQPAQTIVVFTMSDSIGLNATRDHTHSRKWKTWQNVLSDIQPDRFRIDPGGEDRTEGRANYLYADGHVESHTAAWLKEEIEAERNPAQPPLLTQ